MKQVRGKPFRASENEFQAEMAAYVVSQQFGFPSDDFLLSSLVNLTKNKELLDKEKLLQEVNQTSTAFLDYIDSYF